MALSHGTGIERITLLAAGHSHCATVTEGGKLLLWGNNDFGQCGTGTADDSVLAATRCDSGALADADVRVLFIACGAFHTVALTSDGGVVVFGYNLHGQLGTGNNINQLTPTRLACATLDGVRIMGCAAGDYSTQLVSDDGRVFAMGQNDQFVSNDGRVFAMGENNNGQPCTGDTTSVNTPTEIGAAHLGFAPVAAVACGNNHTVSITRDEGNLFCWDEGDGGATGLGHTDDATTPQPVLGALADARTTPQPVLGALADARTVRIVAGDGHSCALAEDGRVFAFGNCDGDWDGGL